MDTGLTCQCSRCILFNWQSSSVSLEVSSNSLLNLNPNPYLESTLTDLCIFNKGMAGFSMSTSLL